MSDKIFSINIDNQNQEKVWIIQRCIDAWTNHYEDWLGYCENLMSRDDMMLALKECNEKWPEYEFRGHNSTQKSVRYKKGE
jgi:hypothetical protein